MGQPIYCIPVNHEGCGVKVSKQVYFIFMTRGLFGAGFSILLFIGEVTTK